MTQDKPASGSLVDMPLSTATNSPRGAQAHAPEQRPEPPCPSSGALDPAPRQWAVLRAREEVGSEYEQFALPPPPPLMNCGAGDDEEATRNDDVEVAFDNDEDDENDSKSPYDKAYRNQALPRKEGATPRDILYSFLVSRTVSQLKGTNGPLKKHKIAQGGSKQMLVSSLLRAVSKRVQNSGGKLNFDSGVVFTSGAAHEWLRSDARSVIGSLLVAPTDEDLETYRPESGMSAGGRRGSGAELTVSAPPFTVDEFSRLMALLVDDEDIKAALMQSGQDLTRKDLERRVGRDDFWVDLVEAKFNDPAVIAALPCSELPPSLHGVNPNCVVPARRSGEALKKKLFDTRASFTTFYDNWSRSGQNDISNFEQFVVPSPPGSNTLPILSKFCLLIFHATGCGDEGHTHFDVLSWIAKVGRAGVVYDDDDDTESTMRTSKKPRTAAAATELTSALVQGLHQISNSMVKLAGGPL
jgi:hypothetical protein